MPDYVTLSELTDRYGGPMLVRLTDHEEAPSGAIDLETVRRAVADTGAMIDGYLASRYALPMAQVPGLVRDLAAVIAIYKLHRYEPDEKIVRDYKDALATLKSIQGGGVRLDIAGVPAPGTGGSGARMTDRARPFTEANMKGFI